MALQAIRRHAGPTQLALYAVTMFEGYRALSDLEGFNADIQLAALIGLVATEAASIEETVTNVTARFTGPEWHGEAARQAYLRRRDRIARKQFAAKLEILELVWPHRWTPIDPLLAALRTAARHRNDLAHTWASIDVMAMLQEGGDIHTKEPRDYWMRSTRSGGSISVDLPAIDAVLQELRALNSRIQVLYFLEGARDLPLNMPWHYANPPGSFTRIDKPERDPEFPGWRAST